MKKALLKYPYKLQDLIILEITKIYCHPKIEVIPTEFMDPSEDVSYLDIALGLGKDVSRCCGFEIAKTKPFNDRDINYIQYLRFGSKLPSSEGIKVREAISKLRKNLLSNSDKKSEKGVYNIGDITQMLDSYTGYKDDMLEEYNKKSEILNLWIKSIISKEPKVSSTSLIKS
jgi:hypothetical protein